MKWWMVHGSARSGTSFMLSLIRSCARKWVGDWGLGNMLRLTPDLDHIRFDKQRALQDISKNILDNAYPGKGDQLDLAFKQADIQLQEYEQLVSMWGPAERIIFCFRDPAGYMPSAMKHWPGYRKELLQRVYIETLQNYNQIGGDIFEYTAELTAEDYKRFLKPLRMTGMEFEFRYTGSRDSAATSAEMWEIYERFKMRMHGQKG